MKTLFAFIVFATFGVWLAISYVPARNVWYSTHRLFVVQLVLFIPYWLLGLYAVYDASHWITRVQRRCTPIPWQTDFHDSRRTFNACGVVVLVFMTIIGFMPIFFASEANPGWALTRSPCGASSCSSETGSSGLVYNPAGLPPHLDLATYVPIIGIYEGCNWASSDGRPRQGFDQILPSSGAVYPDYSKPCSPASPPCDDLASNRTIDNPNLGTGGAHGFFSGLGVSKASDTALCPFVDAVFYQDANNQTQFGKGQGVCSYCYPYWDKYYSGVWTRPANTKHCVDDPGAVDNALWCGILIPGPLENREPRVLAQIVVYWYMAAALPFASWAIQELFGWSYRYTVATQKKKR